MLFSQCYWTATRVLYCALVLSGNSVHQHSAASVANELTWYCLLVTYHQAMCVKGSLLPFLAVAISCAA